VLRPGSHRGIVLSLPFGVHPVNLNVLLRAIDEGDRGLLPGPAARSGPAQRLQRRARPFVLCRGLNLVRVQVARPPLVLVAEPKGRPGLIEGQPVDGEALGGYLLTGSRGQRRSQAAMIESRLSRTRFGIHENELPPAVAKVVAIPEAGVVRKPVRPHPVPVHLVRRRLAQPQRPLVIRPRTLRARSLRAKQRCEDENRHNNSTQSSACPAACPPIPEPPFPISGVVNTLPFPRKKTQIDATYITTSRHPWQREAGWLSPQRKTRSGGLFPIPLRAKWINISRMALASKENPEWRAVSHTLPGQMD